jgi:hypothetical protein
MMSKAKEKDTINDNVLLKAGQATKRNVKLTREFVPKKSDRVHQAT